jgi:hypothetical protein
MTTPYRYRQCPRCHVVRPGGEFPPVRFGSGHWRAGGWSWRRCPACGHKGSTRDFKVVKG